MESIRHRIASGIELDRLSSIGILGFGNDLYGVIEIVGVKTQTQIQPKVVIWLFTFTQLVGKSEKPYNVRLALEGD